MPILSAGRWGWVFLLGIDKAPFRDIIYLSIPLKQNNFFGFLCQNKSTFSGVGNGRASRKSSFVMEDEMQRKLWEDDTKTKTIIEVSVSSLSISNYNPRKSRNDEYIQRLADRIAANGYEITRAMWAYQDGEGYKVFAGGTRLKAVRLVGFERVPVVLHTGFTDGEIVRLADEDNENDEYHEPVPLVDVWASYKALADFGKFTQKEIAKAKGCSQTNVNFRIRLAKLPESVLKIITTHLLKERQVRELLGLLPGNNSWLSQETALLHIITQALKSNPTAQTFKTEVQKVNDAIGLVENAVNGFDAKWKAELFKKLRSYKNKGLSKANAQRAIDTITRAIAKEKREIAQAARIAADEAEREKIKAEREAEAAEHRLLIESLKTGQWWKLGGHLLYCGDTSKKEFYENLPNAAFAFADPPYNADAAEWDNSFNWAHDWLSDKAGIVAVTPGISSIFDFGRKTEMPYKWSMSCWISNGMTRGALGFGNWIFTALFSELKSIHRQKQDFFKISIRTSQTGETKHKGRKPAEYMSKLIEIFSSDGDLIIDPFAGSGSTLLVCEELSRRCICGEINADFCKDIIGRWEEKTGRGAQLEHDTV